MKLTFHLISYLLSKQFKLAYAGKNPNRLLVDRPIYYLKEQNCCGHAVLIKAADLIALEPDDPLLANSIFICFGTLPTTFCRKDIDLVTMDCFVSHKEVLNELQSVFNRFAHWETAMREAIYENQSFSQLIDNCDPIIEAPLSLTDHDFAYVAYSRLSYDLGLVDKFVTEDRALPMDLFGMLVSDPEYLETSNAHEVFTFTLDAVTSLHINIFYEGTRVGRLSTICSDCDTANYYHKDILILLSAYIEKLYSRYRSFYLDNIALGSFHELLVKQLSGQAVSQNQWQAILDGISWSNEDTYLLVQFRPSHRYDKTMYAKYLCPELEKRWFGSCCVEYKEFIFLVLNETQFVKSNQMDFPQELAYFLRDSLLAAGISRSFQGLENLSTAFRQTEIAFKIGPRKDPMFWYFRFNDYALDYLLQHGAGGFSPAQICSEKLYILIKHDEEVHTEYYKTLQMYFLCKYNAALTAKKLYIHRSTFLNRVERIMEITSLNLDSFRNRTYLALSFLILEEHRSLS